MSRRTDKLKEKQNKEPEKRCARCLRPLNYVETEVGEIRLWCYYCESPFISGQNISLTTK